MQLAVVVIHVVVVLVSVVVIGMVASLFFPLYDHKTEYTHTRTHTSDVRSYSY